MSTGDWNLVTDGEPHDVTVNVAVDSAKTTVDGISIDLGLYKGEGDQPVQTKKVAIAQGETKGSVVFQVTEAGEYTVKEVAKTYLDGAQATFKVKSVASMADLFSAGKATQGTDSATGRTVTANADGVFVISGVDGKTIHVVTPTYVVPEGATAPIEVSVAPVTGGTGSGYFLDNNGSVGVEINKDYLEYNIGTGDYWVRVAPADADSPYAGGVLFVKVEQTKASVEGVYAYDGSDVEDTTFTYDAQIQAVNFASGNGTKLAGATAVYYKADGSFVGTDGNTAPTEAGSYYAVVDIDGAGAGTETVTVPFEVGVLDLSAVSITVNDIALADNAIANPEDILKGATVNGEKLAANTDLAGKLSLNAGLVDHRGEYTATIAPADDEDKNITGAGSGTFKAVKEVVAAFQYDDVAWATAFPSDPVRVFNNSVQGFDEGDIAVLDANGNPYAKSRYAVTLTDEEGNEVSSAAQAGTYFVTVSMVSGSDWALGGKATGKFTVTKGTVEAAKVSVTFDGKAVGNGFAAPYDGTNLADKFAVAVTLGGEQLVQGTDYEVVFEDNDKTGATQATDSVVDVNKGGYKLVVKGIGYAGEVEFAFTVEPVTAKALKVDEGAFGGVAWTGEAVAPTILYSTKAAADSTAADWKVLDPEMYSTVYKTSEKDYVDGKWDGAYTDGDVIPASEVVDAGTYAVIVSLYSDVANLAFDASLSAEAQRTLHFDVAKTAGYVDVPADAWYAESVYKAKDNGFMSGVASGIFAPERTMTRAEFAQTVYNMAHEAGEQGANNAWETYPTQFSDVEPNAWYAKAVEWAARYGIVTGKSATTFDPNGTVTREEIATMLYRYIGNGAKADASVLDRFEDKAEVCDWAVDAMAWAVEEGVVNGVSETSLAPHGDAQRCMVAAMAVRAQPERIEEM